MTGEIFFEDLRLGQEAGFGKATAESDIVLSAAVAGYADPMHLDAEHAKGTILGERVAHGMPAAGLVIEALGTRSPGPRTIHPSRTPTFRPPVRIGRTEAATVEVAAPAPRTLRAAAGAPAQEGDACASVPVRRTPGLGAA